MKPAEMVIDTDRSCLECGYNLRGLKAQGVCPECGATMSIPEDIDESLSLMPRAVINRLRRGCWTMFWVCAGVMLVCLVGIFGQGTPEVVGSILTGAALVWFGGVWYALPVLDMPQARIRGLHSRGRLRKAAILLQLGWALASGAILLQLAFPRSSWLFEPVAHWSVVLAGAGLIMLAILWQRLAEWTRDSDVEKIFFVVMWGLPLAGYILYAHPALVSLTRLLYLVVMVVFLAVPLGLFSLARAMSLCVYHSQEHEARTDRQKERHEKFFQGVIDPYIQAITGEESAED